jgi:hypothetical protein
LLLLFCLAIETIVEKYTKVYSLFSSSLFVVFHGLSLSAYCPLIGKTKSFFLPLQTCTIIGLLFMGNSERISE